MSIVDLLQQQIAEYKTLRMNEDEYYKSMYEIMLTSKASEIINKIYHVNIAECCDKFMKIELPSHSRHEHIKDCIDKKYLEMLLDQMIIAVSYNEKLNNTIFYKNLYWEDVINDIQDFLYPCEF